jgi:hypothetical protein
MNWFRLLTIVGLASATTAAQAEDQMYGQWSYSQSKGYFYCSYLYKSDPGDSAFKKQYVIYAPKKDQYWVYWCNPKDNPDNKAGVDKYWGRCPTKAHPKLGKLVKEGKDVWSILPPDKRKSRLGDLVEADFPEAKVMAPPVPGSTDPKRTIPCPPDPPDLPD